MDQLLPAQGSQAGKAISNVPNKRKPALTLFPTPVKCLEALREEMQADPDWGSRAAERHQMRNYAQQQH